MGQALTENAVYDSESGQLVTGSFMDYGMPHAEIMPIELREAVHTVPATTNPLGVKGTGEAGTTAAIAAVMNAVVERHSERRRRPHGNAGNAGEGVGGVSEGDGGEVAFSHLSPCGRGWIALSVSEVRAG